MMKPNIKRQAKDHLFVDLFNRPEYCLQLYKALHPEDTEVTEADISNITIHNVVVDRPYNDLGFGVRDKLLMLVEAQSSWSYNILLRLLLYLTDTLVGMIDEHKEWNIHGSKPLPLPVPEFYVIYTGERAEIPETLSLRRDFFKNGDAWIDLKARVISAESTDDIIGQYILFAHIYDQQVKLHGYTRKAAEEVLRICKDRGALLEYLSHHEKEVATNMITLFEQEEAIKRYGRSKLEEGLEKGLEKGKAEGIAEATRGFVKRILASGGTVDTVVQMLGLSKSEVQRICDEG